MNRFLICLFICFVMISPLKAQLIRSYGAKVAYTSANQDYNYKILGRIDTDRRSGFNAAAFVEWLDVPFVSVVTQLEYAQRGKAMELVITSELGPDIVGKETRQDRVDYLSIPVMGKLRLPFGMFSPFVEAGPRVDFLLGYQSAYGGSDAVYDAFKKTNLGATIGLGSEVHAPTLPVTLSLEARYNFDLADSYSTDLLKVHNNSFDVWLGVGF